MPAIMPTHLLTLGQCRTPEEFKAKVHELLDPALAQYRVCNSDVMFVTYIEPEQTAGGLFKSDRTQQEVLFQGNVGLVVGLGPLVNKYDSRGVEWASHEVKIGDWIVVRFADCWETHVEGVSCRLIDPENIRGIIDTPEIITSRPKNAGPVISRIGGGASVWAPGASQNGGTTMIGGVR